MSSSHLFARNLLYDRLSFAADNMVVQVPARLFGNGYEFDRSKREEKRN